MAGVSHRVDSDFVHFVVESLQSLGPVVSKRMFGGHGLFLHDIMFALVAWDTLYFKVDDENRPSFEAKGLEPFAYTDQRGRLVKMSYYEAPADELDEPDALGVWAKNAYAAALRARPVKTAEKNDREKRRA